MLELEVSRLYYKADSTTEWVDACSWFEGFDERVYQVFTDSTKVSRMLDDAAPGKAMAALWSSLDDARWLKLPEDARRLCTDKLGVRGSKSKHIQSAQGSTLSPANRFHGIGGAIVQKPTVDLSHRLLGSDEYLILGKVLLKDALARLGQLPEGERSQFTAVLLCNNALTDFDFGGICYIVKLFPNTVRVDCSSTLLSGLDDLEALVAGLRELLSTSCELKVVLTDTILADKECNCLQGFGLDLERICV